MSSDVNIYPPNIGGPMHQYYSTTSQTTAILVQQLQHLLGHLVAQSDTSAGRKAPILQMQAGKVRVKPLPCVVYREEKVQGAASSVAQHPLSTAKKGGGGGGRVRGKIQWKRVQDEPPPSYTPLSAWDSGGLRPGAEEYMPSWAASGATSAQTQHQHPSRGGYSRQNSSRQQASRGPRADEEHIAPLGKVVGPVQEQTQKNRYSPFPLMWEQALRRVRDQPEQYRRGILKVSKAQFGLRSRLELLDDADRGEDADGREVTVLKWSDFRNRSLHNDEVCVRACICVYDCVRV
jgi:hypothetical protein